MPKMAIFKGRFDDTQSALLLCTNAPFCSEARILLEDVEEFCNSDGAARSGELPFVKPQQQYFIRYFQPNCKYKESLTIQSAYNQEVVLTERVYRYLVCSTLPCIQEEIGHNSRHDNAFRSIFLENDDINQTSTKSPHPIVCSATWAKGLHESRDMHWQHGLLVDMGGDTTSALEPSR